MNEARAKRNRRFKTRRKRARLKRRRMRGNYLVRRYWLRLAKKSVIYD